MSDGVTSVEDALGNISISGNVDAQNTSFDNSDNGMVATNVQSAIEEVNNKISSITVSTDAKNTAFDNSNNGMTATNVQDAIEENKTNILSLQNTSGSLSNLNTTSKDNLVSAINEVFQSANSGKSTIASAVGSPLTSSDTFSAMGTKINTIKSTMATNLKSKGVSATSSETMTSLADKIKNIANTTNVYGGLPKWMKGGYHYYATNYPQTLRSVASSAVGTNIYCTGGADSSNSQKYNYCYNTLTNAWSTKTAMPTARDAHAFETVGTKIYAIGGYSLSSYVLINKNECYDTASNTWSTKTVIPTAAKYINAGAVGTNIYCIGGNTSSGYSSTNYCYDTVANTWSTKTKMPTARYGSISQVIGTKIYVIGGYSSTTYNINECYDTKANTWSTKTKMPTDKCHGFSGAVGNLIYCLGGRNSDGYSSNSYIYNASSNTWESISMNFDGRYECGHCMVDGTLYYTAGLSTTGSRESGHSAIVLPINK